MKTSNRLLIILLFIITALLFISFFLFGGPRGDKASKQEESSPKFIVWIASPDITSNLDVLEKGSIIHSIENKLAPNLEYILDSIKVVLGEETLKPGEDYKVSTSLTTTEPEEKLVIKVNLTGEGMKKVLKASGEKVQVIVRADFNVEKLVKEDSNAEELSRGTPKWAIAFFSIVILVGVGVIIRGRIRAKDDSQDTEEPNLWEDQEAPLPLPKFSKGRTITLEEFLSGSAPDQD